MRRARQALAILFTLTLVTRCIAVPPLRDPPSPPLLVAIETPTGDLDGIGRVPSLTLRFDRPVAWPDEGAALLVTGSPSDGLRADAADGVLSASNVARRVSVRLSRDPLDSAVIHVDALAALLPDTPATLLVSSLLRSDEGVAFNDADSGRRARSIPLTVAPARRCGALARVEPVSPGDGPANTAKIFVRFDRPVRLSRAVAPLSLSPDGAAPVATRASLDCLDGDTARCAWVEPVDPLVADTVYRVGFGPLAASNGARVESELDTFATGPRRDAPRVGFGPSPVCGADEVADGDLCVRVAAGAIEVRASTTGPAIMRVTAVSSGDPPRVALGASGTLHRVLIATPREDTVYALTVECIGLDGRAHETRSLDARRSAPTRPRVRITEVLARPRSTSAQEFVELFNEGAAPADLTGYALSQGASRSALPEGAVIPAGRRAIVVGASFDPRGVASQGDPPVAPGATLIALRGALAGRGLRDTGADVSLTDPEGRVVSQMPGSAPSRAPRAGVSIVRAETSLDDLDPAAWAYDAMEGSTPGAPDRLR